jgi:hypothetical protein
MLLESRIRKTDLDIMEGKSRRIFGPKTRKLTGQYLDQRQGKMTRQYLDQRQGN